MLSKGIFVLVITACLGLSSIAGAQTDNLETQRIEMIKETGQGIVSLKGARASRSNREVPDFFKDYLGESDDLAAGKQEVTVETLGAGFVFDAEAGLVVTAGHIVENAKDPFTIELDSGEHYSAKLAGVDTDLNIAVLITSPLTVQALSFAELDAKAGETAFVHGRLPGFESPFVTQGMVSQGRTFISDEMATPFIIIDAHIPPASGGGPVTNLQGEVIGIAAMVYSHRGVNGLGFAIPTAELKPLLYQLAEQGSITRSYLGITVDCDLVPDSCLLTAVENDSPAENAGLKVGDEIIQYNGKSAKSVASLAYDIGNLQVGTEVNLALRRNGRELSQVLVTVARRPE